MKIGCCVNMVAEDAAGIGIDRIETLAALGYDYVELPLAQMMALDDAAYEALVQRVEASGLKCLANNNFFPATMRLTGPETTPTDELEAYIKRGIQRALRLGSKSIVFGSSGAKNIPAGFAYDTAWNQVVDVLRLVDKCIDGRDICIAIEPLNKLESNMILTAVEGLTLVKAVDRPHIRLLVDFYHLSMEHEDVAIIGEAAKYLQHMHIANPVGRVWPKAGDGATYSDFIGALAQAGYDGCISIEAFSDDFDTDAKEAIGFMRGLVSSQR